MEQTLMDKLTILADSAKYDVACTSSGASRTARAGTLGSCYAPGCCHAFTPSGQPGNKVSHCNLPLFR